MNAKLKKLLVLGAMAFSLCAAPVKGLADTVVDGHKVKDVDFVVINGTETVKDVILIFEDNFPDKTIKNADVKISEAKGFEQKPATCKEEGQLYYEYTINNETWYSDNIRAGKKADHKWVDGVISIVQATCATDGKTVTGTYCEVCGTEKTSNTVVVKATGKHVPKVTNVAGTNTSVDKNGVVTLVNNKKAGYYTEVTKCAVCGKVLDETIKTVDAVFHEETVEWYTETVADSKTNTQKIIGSDGKEKIALIDCSKKGEYKEITYDKDGDVIRTNIVTVPAGHTTGIVTVSKKSLSKFVGIVEGTEKAVRDANGKVIEDLVIAKVANASCAEVGSYEEVVLCEVCKKVISRTKKEVPKSEIHSFTTKEANPKYTCVEGGSVDIVTYCAVCGLVDKTETKNHKAVGHHDSDFVCELGYKHEADPISKYSTTVENEVKPTAHHTGSYDAVLICKYGVEHDRTHVTTDATNPDKFQWKFDIEWIHNGDAIHENNVLYFGDWYEYNPKRGKWMEAEGDTIKKINDLAYVIAIPTDDDLTADEIKEFTERVDRACEVKEDTSKRVVGDECKLGSRTFYVDIPSYNDRKFGKVPALHAEETYDFVPEGYVGHEGYAETLPWEELEDGRWVKICPTCGEIIATGKVPTDKKEEDKTEKIDISNAVIANEGETPYRGEYQPIPYTVTVDGKVLTWHVDYEVTNAKQNVYKGVGWHGIEIIGKGNYTGTAKGKLWIVKGTNKVKVNVSKKTFKAAALKKAAQSFEVKVTKKAGSLKAVSSDKSHVKVKKVETGVYKITVKKGTPAGKYTVTFNAAESKNYTAAKKTVKITVK